MSDDFLSAECMKRYRQRKGIYQEPEPEAEGEEQWLARLMRL